MTNEMNAFDTSLSSSSPSLKHYKGELGEFDYNPDEWGVKTTPL